jgi:hypothetical protein
MVSSSFGPTLIYLTYPYWRLSSVSKINVSELKILLEQNHIPYAVRPVPNKSFWALKLDDLTLIVLINAGAKALKNV